MKRNHFGTIIAGLALVVFTATGFAASDKMSDKVKNKSHGGGNDKVSVIVQYHAKPDQAEDHRLNGLGATDKRAYGKLKMRALKIKASKLDDLVNDPDVRFVTLDSTVEAYTRAARLASNELLTRKGVPLHEGDGIGVAVLDSGISTHNDVHKGESLQYTFLQGAAGIETAHIDDLGFAKALFDGRDAPLGKTLLLLGRVILRVLFQIAVGTGLGNRIDDARPVYGFQFLQFAAQFLRALSRQWWSDHAATSR